VESLRLQSTTRCTTGVRVQTDDLLRRMLSPLVGLNTQIGHTLRTRSAPRFMMLGAEMTGIHVLQGQPRPPRGHYHIGGAGIHLDEALIRSLGETVERYTQFASGIQWKSRLVWASLDDLRRAGAPTISYRMLAVYSDRQYALKGFPFRPFAPDAPLMWVGAVSLVTRTPIWVPAQLAFVGYNLRTDRHEARIGLAVTTGGAAHVTETMAMRNGLLELIQIDSAMTHWYGGRPAVHIALDARTRGLQRIVERRFSHAHARHIQFYWLRDSQFPVFSVACVIRDPNGAIPCAVVGLGADLRLEEALYKALLEAMGIVQLAKVTLMNLAVTRGREALAEIDPDAIFDLDTNVGYYALPGHAETIGVKFDERVTQRASDLPGDGTADAAEAVSVLVDRFRQLDLELIGLDLTTADARALGFRAYRAWSPNLVTLCMPGAPPAAHPRFESFGGFRYVGPHPYP